MEKEDKKGKYGEEKRGKVTEKDIKILQTLKDNPEGLRATTLEKLADLKGRTLYNRLSKLKKQKFIINISPIWKLCQIQSEYPKLAELLKSNKIQLHDFSFVVKLIKKPDWWEKRGNRLMKLKEFQFKKVTWGNNPYIQLIKDNFIIQCFSTSIIFINNKKYYGQDSYDCFIQATRDFLELFRYIEEKTKFKFFLDGVPQVNIRSQHYVRLKDVIAKKCKKTGKTFEVCIDGKLRMWVDMSEPLGVEAGHKDYAPEDMRIYNNYVSDIISKNPMKPSEVTQISSQNTIAIRDLTNISQNLYNNQALTTSHTEQFGKQLALHLSVLTKIGKGIDKLSKVVGSISKDYKITKERLKAKEQSKLDRFL